MLRPLLEQAADPIHLHQTGQAQSFLNKVSSNVNSNGNAAATSSKPTKPEIPVAIILYKPSNVVIYYKRFF